MFIKPLDNRNNTKVLLLFLCDDCLELFARRKLYFDRYIKNHIYKGKDYCTKCCRKYINNDPNHIKNMVIGLKKVWANPSKRLELSQKNKGKINLGDKNGMKNPLAQKKVSDSRKKMFADNPHLAEAISKRSSQAWKDGKFEGVRVGQCKWYNYHHSNGRIYKVQGTWELAFIKWLDENDLEFECHKKWIPYVLNGKKKNWYPDFFVKEWNAYVDVKCPHFYIEEKFEALRTCNPDIKIIVLFKADLEKLGVKFEKY